MTHVLLTDVTVIFRVSRTQGAGLCITVRAGASIHDYDLIKEKQQQMQHINNTKI